MPKKKKIAFVANCCIVGGVETALINLLNTIDTEKYDVTLYTNFAGNPVVKNIPDYVKCVNLDEYNIKNVYNRSLKERNYLLALSVIWNYIRFIIARDEFNKTEWLYKHIAFCDTEYDIVIAYKWGPSTTAIAKKLVKRNRAILWIHGELPMFRRTYELNLFMFDKCFCTSEYIKTYFSQRCPSLKDKTDIFHNILDAEAISKKAQEPVNDIDTNRKYVLVTVGRLGQDKGQTVIPETARLLADAGIDFVWYLVGDGPTRDAVEHGIRAYNMEDHVYLLGTKENPYPYIKACTIYVQTSTSEGWCLTTQEARILRKPCIVTNIPVMHEQFVDGENGIIAKGTDADSLYHGIMRLIESDELRNRIIDNLSTKPQDGANEIQKLYDYIEGK